MLFGMQEGLVGSDKEKLMQLFCCTFHIQILTLFSLGRDAGEYLITCPPIREQRFLVHVSATPPLGIFQQPQTSVSFNSRVYVQKKLGSVIQVPQHLTHILFPVEICGTRLYCCTVEL